MPFNYFLPDFSKFCWVKQSTANSAVNYAKGLMTIFEILFKISKVHLFLFKRISNTRGFEEVGQDMGLQFVLTFI